MKLFLLKIQTSVRAIGRMYRRHPGKILLTTVLFVILLAILLWIFNLNLLGYVIFTQDLSFGEKLQFLLGIYTSIFTNFDVPQAFSLVLFAALFSINLTLLVFVIGTRGKLLQAKQKQTSAASALLAIVASGCAACGTSILTPLLLSLGAGSTIALSRTIGIVISYLSLLLVAYSIYSLGASVANVLAIEKTS